MSFSPPLLLPLTGQIDILVTSSSGGAYVRGVYVKSTPTSRTIKANVQPVLKSTDTLILSEGDRYKEVIKIYTTEPLLSRREGVSPVEGDLVSYNGKVFEVMRVIEYKMGILNHWKSIAVRKEVT